MKYLYNLLRKLLSIFNSNAAKATFNKVAELAAQALPYIDAASQIVAGLTPTLLDDAALAFIRSKFPKLFDGTIHTGEELKLYALAIATELLKLRFPGVSTSIARAAAQLAYTGATADTKAPNAGVYSNPQGELLRAFPADPVPAPTPTQN